MRDYIGRKQAIRAITTAALPDKTADGVPIANGKRSVTDCIRRLKAIPAADVRPVVRGKWEPVVAANEDGSPYQAGIHCSECGHFDVWEFNFCPNCGADMREES